MSWNAFDGGIQNFIFDELKGRADDADKVNTTFVARGGWILTNSGNNTEHRKYYTQMIEKYIPVMFIVTRGVQKLWSVWNIRGFMILSLFLQVLLASIARLRKKSKNRFLVFTIWSAYFMADWAATFTFGLISNARCNDSINPPEVDENLLSFWAAFLLIHLGGPDTITAFSLEDNALWTRHLVGLVAQLFTFFYIFLKTLPGNNLFVPTILIAVAGVIKYGERTRALYLASMENLKKSYVKLPDESPLSSHDTDMILHAEDETHLCQVFKGLVADIMPDDKERRWSRRFILSNDASNAFRSLVTELDLLYELFYTKILAANSTWGILARTIAYYNILAALVLFCLSKKEGFHEVDVWITFFLLGSIFALETFSGIMRIVSDWSQEDTRHLHMWALAQGLCFIIPGIVVLMVLLLISLVFPKLIEKSWCEKLGAFNLMVHCFGQYRRGGNKITMYARIVSRFFTACEDTSWNAFDEEIWRIIFQELKQRALLAVDADKLNAIFIARGKWTLMEPGNNREHERNVVHFDYDRNLLAWHIATEICYNTNGAIDGTERDHRKLAKMLSDYMNYLLIKKPEMMSAVAGIGHIRYRETCTEITLFCRLFESKTVNEFCTNVVDEVTSSEPAHMFKDKDASVLSDACNLAKVLRQKENRWEIISRAWLEMLMYAAGHCRPEKHARALCEGGELLTIVWLLMAHMGIGPHFPYPQED